MAGTERGRARGMVSQLASFQLRSQRGTVVLLPSRCQHDPCSCCRHVLPRVSIFVSSARHSGVRRCDTAFSGSCKKTLYARRQDFGAVAMMKKVALQRQAVCRAHVQQSAANCWRSARRRTLPIGHRSVRRNQRKRRKEKTAREYHDTNLDVAAVLLLRLCCTRCM